MYYTLCTGPFGLFSSYVYECHLGHITHISSCMFSQEAVHVHCRQQLIELNLVYSSTTNDGVG